MPYENNHYVPQFLLRKFNSHLSVYDLQKESFIRNADTRNVFSSRKLYTEEIEKELSQKIETPFADLFNKKLLPAPVNEELTLTRKELNLIRKFLLVEQIRVWIDENEHNPVKDFFIKHPEEYGMPFPFTEKVIQEESEKDRWLRNLRVVIESKDLHHIAEHELCTYEIYRWAQIYNSGYMAIWDSSLDGTDFIISDSGMTSEVEQSFVTYGFEFEKTQCLEQLIERFEADPRQEIYVSLLQVQKYFYENFYMYTLSKNRMLVIINPFFRLYTKREKLYEPSIWPTEIRDRRLFEANKSTTKIVAGGHPVLSPNDCFRYKIHSVKHQDVLYINALMLDRIDRYVGFASLNHSIESIQFYINWHQEHNMTPPKNYKPLLEICH